MSKTADLILDQAEQDMRLSGFHAVSFRDLAASLGIKSASVHYHFPKKEDLGVALVKRYSQNFFDALESETRQATSPEDFIDGLVGQYRKSLFDDHRICLCGLLGAESAGLPADVSETVAAFHQQNIEWLSAKLDSGAVASDRRSAAARIVSTLQGAMMMAHATGDLKLFDQVTEHMSAA